MIILVTEGLKLLIEKIYKARGTHDHEMTLKAMNASLSFPPRIQSYATYRGRTHKVSQRVSFGWSSDMFLEKTCFSFMSWPGEHYLL